MPLFKKKEGPPQPKHGWDETIKTVVYAVLLAVVFRSFLFEPFHIPSGSMKDTLLVGDYIFVSKYSYGYSRYSFPFGAAPIEGRIWKTAPKRGDIVVFRPPSSPRVDFIKRLIGLPGDRIQVRDSVLYINDVAVPRELSQVMQREGACYRMRRAGEPSPKLREYTETLPNGVSYKVLDCGVLPRELDGFEADNTKVYTVPPGHYFMMGDNRDDSTDSRYLKAVGFIPEENLVGRAEIILFSLGDDAQFWLLWKWPFSLRYNRFVQMIEP